MPTRTILLFGGRSAEHEVSILSARSVANAAPKSRIEIVPVCIARDGRFVAPERSARILEGGEKSDRGDEEFSMEAWTRSAFIDCVFPLIHGTGGEDGTLRVWDVASGQCIRVIQGHISSLSDVDWSPDGTHVVSGSADALVTIYDVAGETHLACCRDMVVWCLA